MVILIRKIALKLNGNVSNPLTMPGGYNYYNRNEVLSYNKKKIYISSQ